MIRQRTRLKDADGGVGAESIADGLGVCQACELLAFAVIFGSVGGRRDISYAAAGELAEKKCEVMWMPAGVALALVA